MVSNAHQVLAIDTQHSLFLSDDAGNHWKAVPAQWKGRAVKVELASSTALKQLSAGTATAEAPSANFGATGGLVTTRTPITSAILTGSVTDGSGAAISNASVVVGNATTPNAGTVKTDRAGHYLIDGLIPGSYWVVAEAPGFNKQQARHHRHRLAAEFRQSHPIRRSGHPNRLRQRGPRSPRHQRINGNRRDSIRRQKK